MLKIFLERSFVILIIFIATTQTSSLSAYTSRPPPEQVLKDFQDAVEPKIKKYQGDKEWVLPHLKTEAVYFENKNNKNQTLIVIQSGIHGVETYAGSFLQQIFLKDYFKKYWKAGHSILLVHAYNSWGFLNHRRFAESGVDLNRNHDTTRDIFKTKNEKYKYIRKYLLREGKVNHPTLALWSIGGEFLFANIKEKILGDFSTDDFREALGNGQYQFPKEVGFGGQEFEPQVLWAQKRLPKIFRNYKKILVLDFHTGLGEKGHLHLITSGRESKQETAKILELFSQGIKDKSYEVNTGDSEGFYYTNGDYLAFTRKINPDARIITLAAEFGTMGLSLPGQIQTITRLVLENQGYWQGYGSDSAKEKTQTYILDLFAPNDDDWWKSIEQNGRALFDESLTALDKEW